MPSAKPFARSSSTPRADNRDGPASAPKIPVAITIDDRDWSYSLLGNVLPARLV
jgi:hypothetical protein